MAGFDQLLQARGVEVMNPMDLEKARLTLGQLANANEVSGLDLQQRKQNVAMMADPRLAAAMAAALNRRSIDAEGMAGLFKDYPMAAFGQFQNQIKMQSELADVDKKQADTDKTNTDRRIAQVQVLSNAADGLANSEGPLMPDKVLTWLKQAQVVGAAPLVGDVVEAMKTGDESKVRSALSNFSQAGATMGQRATARKEGMDTQLGPQRFDLDRYKAMVEAAAKVGGEVRQDVNGNLVIVRPLAGANMPTPPGPANVGAPAQPPTMVNGQFPAGTPAQQVGSLDEARAADAAGRPVSFSPQGQATQIAPAPVAPASGPSGLPQVQSLPVQAAMSPLQASQNATREATLKSANDAAVFAAQAQNIIPALRAEMAQGFTGTLASSEAGRGFLNLAATFKLLTPEQLQRYGQMRAADALSSELLGPMLHAISPRGSNMGLGVVMNRGKPSSNDPFEAASTMMNAMQVFNRNALAYKKFVNDYATAHPEDYALTGLPAFKPEVPARGKVAHELPPPSLANIGYTATDPDTGRKYVNKNGREWTPVQ